jgi:hypothetical protein
MRIAIGGLSAQHSHDRDCRLLTARGNCRRRHTTHAQQEFAPPHVSPLPESIVAAQARLMKMAGREN